MQDRDDIKNAIKVAEATAFELVIQYDNMTRGCLRDATTGEIILVQDTERPEFTCNPDQALALLPAASAAIGTLASELTRHGFLEGGPN